MLPNQNLKLRILLSRDFRQGQKHRLLRLVCFLSLSVLFCGFVKDASAQLLKHFSDMPSRGNRPFQARDVDPKMRIDGTGRMKRERVNPDQDNLTTIPHWTGQFSYGGVTYPYTMVGTNPSLGSATTEVPTVLIPLRFVFADGSVFDANTDPVDGQNVIPAILNSPVFQPHSFVLGGTSVGQTQYGDAFQRANFWNYVSAGSPDYHVLLGQPNVLSSQTINVPADKGSYAFDQYTNTTIPAIEFQFLAGEVRTLIDRLDIKPQTLPIFVSGRVVEGSGFAFHDAYTTFSGDRAVGAQTYIVTSYSEQGVFGGGVSDIAPLTHEINEWLDDPFINNNTPGWEIPFNPNLYGNGRCMSAIFEDELEVADPLAFFRLSIPVPTNSYTYHLADAVFLDFFTRSTPSHSVNGRYSFFNVARTATPPCTGHLEVKYTYFNFPGAAATLGSGINNKGTIVGSYVDLSNNIHGFLLEKGSFTPIDFPGAIQTDVWKINESGLVVGLYFDQTGAIHGFTYKDGMYNKVDFPGAINTEVVGLNSEGEMVGGYDDVHLITHGFVLRSGEFRQLDAPYGIMTILYALNDRGRRVGLNLDSLGVGSSGFLEDRGSFTTLNFPGALFTEPHSIDNSNRVSGQFVDIIFGDYIGFVTLDGPPYEDYRYMIGIVWGSNDKGQVVGTDRGKGFVGRLPQ